MLNLKDRFERLIEYNLKFWKWLLDLIHCSAEEYHTQPPKTDKFGQHLTLGYDY